MTTSGDERAETHAPTVRRAPVSSSEGLLRILLEATMAQGTETRFEVDGGSMLPLVRPHDVVHVRATERAALRRGDVIAVRSREETGLLVHRAVALRDGRVVVHGDNCRAVDGVFSPEDVLGVVTRVERDAKSVWFGAGRWGGLVAWAVRTGLVLRVNRIIYGGRRLAVACLKFARADTRLRERKGEDGNE